MIKDLNRTTANAPQDKPIKVLQFGKGNFLRAFADWMVEAMNEKTGFNGAVTIVQVNSTSNDDRFERQQGLYHVVINGIRNGKNVREIQLIRAIDGIINPFADYRSFLKAGENAALQFIVSNTTEAGITFDPSDTQVEQPAKSFPGKLTALLYHRFTFFQGDPSKAPVVLPCELIERNGEALREAILQYAEHWKLPAEFSAWIHEHVGFCNTLVDRIVPGYPKDTAEEVWRKTGFRDELIVSAEPYHVWVIQPVTTNSFTTERLRAILPLEQAGLNVKFTDDLTPYRVSKVRILNGAHTSMVPIAWLRGIRTVRDAIEDDVTGTFVQQAINEEIIPTLDLPADELRQFSQDVIERFRNPFVRHELSAIALNSISKFQVRVVPTIIDFHTRTGRLPKRLLRALAALILFYKGEWKGEPTPVRDAPEIVSFFQTVWSDDNSASVVRKVLSNENLWKRDLTGIEGLAAEVEGAMDELLAQ